MANTPCGVAWKCATGHCRNGLEEPRSTKMSVNATAVGGVAIMGATGVGGLDGRVCRPLNGSKHRRSTSMVPQQQLSFIASRPELADYGLKLLWVKAQMEHARGATQAQQISAATIPDNRTDDGDVGRGSARRFQSSRERPRAIDVAAPPRSQCAKLAAGGDWDGDERDEWSDHGSGEGQRQRERHHEGIFWSKGSEHRTAMAKAEMGSTGTATTAEHMVIRKAQCRHLDVEVAAKHEGQGQAKCKEQWPVPCWNQRRG